MVLESMGLAERTDPNLWRVRRDFEDVLRAMQRSADRQKMLAAHGVLMSDERLPLVVLDLRGLTTLEGRILVHGEEDTGRQAGRSYLMLEGTDGRVHYVYYTPEMEAARESRRLANEFVHAASKVILRGASDCSKSTSWEIRSRSCATSDTCERPCNGSSGAGLFRKRTAGMDGSVVTRRRLAPNRSPRIA